MKHVSTQVQHRPFVNLCRLILCGVYLRVVLHEVRDALHKFALFLLGLEVLLFRQVRQTYEDVHEDRDLDLLPHILQHCFH